ncbi:MAG: hypothetical protein EOO38_15260 [Cytophagaceae bacterium]|nr:MAG: hypothetical protein EOO38_15260 [Cytophagaceae bacterium]
MTPEQKTAANSAIQTASDAMHAFDGNSALGNAAVDAMNNAINTIGGAGLGITSESLGRSDLLPTSSTSSTSTSSASSASSASSGAPDTPGLPFPIASYYGPAGTSLHCGGDVSKYPSPAPQAVTDMLVSENKDKNAKDTDKQARAIWTGSSSTDPNGAWVVSRQYHSASDRHDMGVLAVFGQDGSKKANPPGNGAQTGASYQIGDAVFDVVGTGAFSDGTKGVIPSTTGTPASAKVHSYNAAANTWS